MNFNTFLKMSLNTNIPLKIAWWCCSSLSITTARPLVREPHYKSRASGNGLHWPIFILSVCRRKPACAIAPKIAIVLEVRPVETQHVASLPNGLPLRRLFSSFAGSGRNPHGRLPSLTDSSFRPPTLPFLLPWKDRTALGTASQNDNMDTTFIFGKA